MLKVYLRIIKRSRVSFVINLAGLSAGLTCAFLIYLWVKDEVSTDKFHKNDKNLYQVLVWGKLENGTEIVTEKTPGPMAGDLPKNIPDIKGAAAVLNSLRLSTLSNGDKSFKAKGIYTESDFFRMFSFDLIEGDKNALLSSERNIVISEDMALKLFGRTDNIVGKLVEFDRKEQFAIAGVLRRMPASSSLKFDYVLPLLVYQRHTGIEVSWNENMAGAYILLDDHANVDNLKDKFRNYVKKLGEDPARLKIFVRKFSDGYLYGSYKDGKQDGGRIDYVRLFSIIAGITLLIACINFISLSTAMATTRMKEVGMKRILGAERKTIILQYISEAVILAFLALVLSVGLLFLLLPAFNALADKQISVSLSFDVILTFIGITFLTGVLSGVYPAFYISGFLPGVVLRNSVGRSTGGGKWIRKGLVIVQFTTSVILIIMTLVIYGQFTMIQSRNLGYNKNNILYWDMEGNVRNHLDAFLAELKRIPGVENASSIYTMTTQSGFFGGEGSTGELSWPGKRRDETIVMNYKMVDYGLIELLNMEMKEGRSFSKEHRSEYPEIIFNETAVKAMGLGDRTVGSTIDLWNAKYKIIGVVRNFYFESIHTGNVKPLFMIRDTGRLNTIMVKVNGDGINRTMNAIKVLNASFNPGYVFTSRFLDEDFQSLYASERRMSGLAKYFSGLAIFISCLGLYGLTAFTVNRRKKEISTRKVLGASGTQIILLLYRDISRLVIVSLAIGLPVGYLMARSWLNGFDLRIELTPWFFVLAALLSFGLMLIASGIQIIRSLSFNPSESLRAE